MRRFLKRFTQTLFLLLILLLAWAVIPVMGIRQRQNRMPLDSLTVKGAYHMHSTFSDGAGTPGTLTRAAKSAGLSFIILTDHGEPNLASIHSTGWKGDVLLVGGSELSTHQGHLACLGAAPLPAKLPFEAPAAARALEEAGWISVLAHPFDASTPWTDLSVRPIHGIEVLNLHEQVRMISGPMATILPLRYALYPRGALIHLLAPPERHLKHWDSMIQKDRIWAFYALDAHGHINSSGAYSLPFPSYESLLSLLNLYVELEHPLSPDGTQAALQLTEAFREGHFYNVIEGLAPANGFSCRVIDPEGNAHRMGSRLQTGSAEMKVHLPFSFATDVRLFRNGVLAESRQRFLGSELSLSLKGPGVYRLEVSLADSRPDLPWILCNPFFLEPSTPRQSPPHQTEPPPAASLYPLLASATTEHSPDSQVRIVREDGGLRVHYRLGGSKETYVSLAVRNLPENWIPPEHMEIEITAAPTCRLTLDLRPRPEDPDSGFRHSLVAREAPGRVLIRRSECLNTPRSLKPWDGSSVRALFLTLTPDPRAPQRDLEGTLFLPAAPHP